VLGQVATIVLFYVVWTKIRAEKNLRLIQAPKRSTIGFTSEADSVTMSISDYDTSELSIFFFQAMTRMVVMVFLHCKWGLTVPLVVSLVSTPITLLNEKLMQCHLFGKQYGRPFTQRKYADQILYVFTFLLISRGEFLEAIGWPGEESPKRRDKVNGQKRQKAE